MRKCNYCCFELSRKILSVSFVPGLTSCVSILGRIRKVRLCVSLHATSSLIVDLVEESNLRNWWRIFSKNVIPLKPTIMAFASKGKLCLILDRVSPFHISPNATKENIFLLILTAMMKIVLTAWTFGMMVSSRVFQLQVALSPKNGRFQQVYSFRQ